MSARATDEQLRAAPVVAPDHPLARAFVAILNDRHPNHTWRALPPANDDPVLDRDQPAAA